MELFNRLKLLHHSMENVLVHDLICYCTTFGELHFLKTTLIRLLNLLKVIPSLSNTKVTLSRGPQTIHMSLFMVV